MRLERRCSSWLVETIRAKQGGGRLRPLFFLPVPRQALVCVGLANWRQAGRSGRSRADNALSDAALEMFCRASLVSERGEAGQSRQGIAEAASSRSVHAPSDCGHSRRLVQGSPSERGRAKQGGGRLRTHFCFARPENRLGASAGLDARRQAGRSRPKPEGERPQWRITRDAHSTCSTHRPTLPPAPARA